MFKLYGRGWRLARKIELLASLPTTDQSVKYPRDRAGPSKSVFYMVPLPRDAWPL